MINIILSCSQQSWNKCKFGDTEQDHTYLIAQAVAELLKVYDCNVCVVPKVSGTENETLQKVVDYSNAFVKNNTGNLSFHLDLHSDAGGGNGCTGFYLSESGRGFIQAVYNSLSLISPWVDRGISKRDFYVLRETDAVAGLIEIAFHDNVDGANWIHGNIQKIAQAITTGIAVGTGIQKKMLDYVFAVETLFKSGVISNKELWTQYAIKDGNIKALLFNMTKYINSKK
jgi:N-acetylmuramoyl-L-alanine amidase